MPVERFGAVSIVGFDSSLLTGWYNSRITTNLAQGSGPSGASSRSTASEPVVTPWDTSVTQSLEELQRRVLASGEFFGDANDTFSDLEAPDDHKQLFELYVGLKRLLSVAEEAQDRNISSYRRDFLNNAFQDGLGQLDTFFDDMGLDELTLLKGEELSKIESEVAVSRGLSQYKTGTLHTGDYDAEVASLTGDVQFTVSVTKSGIQTDIDINLADMGATTRSMSNIVDHINTQLEANGMVSRFEVSKIGEEDENGIVPGDDYGFLIKGVSTEALTFSATAAEPAVYVTGVSGISDSAGGQITKVTGVNSGTPSVGVSTRIEADSNEIEKELPGGEDGETFTTTEANALELFGSAAAADGGVFVVGRTTDTTDGQVIKGEADMVLAKYDSNGKEIWSRVLGAGDDAEGVSVAVDSSGNVIVAGNVTGTLGDTTDVGGEDSFVTKFDNSGVEQWTQRFGGTGDDTVSGVAVASDGSVYVAGKSTGGFGGEVHLGGAADGYVRAFDSNGTTQYTRRIGGAGDETLSAITVDDSDNLVIASVEDGVGLVRKYDSTDGTAAAIWEHSLGDMEAGRIGDVEVDGTDIYVAGSAGSSFSPSAPLTAHNGDARDAFLLKMTDGASPTVDYTTFLGSSGDETANDITVHDGQVYLAGKTTGELSGATQLGDRDAFVSQVDGATGTVNWTTQITGRGGVSEGFSVSVGAQDDSILNALGLPAGELVYADSRVVTDRSSARDGDHFYLSVNGGSRKKITIDDDDSMRSLTFKINAVLVLDGTASVRRSSEGDQLRLSAAENQTIEIFSGTEGQDLLKALGLEPGAITNRPSSLDDDETTADAPPLFSLDLPRLMNLTDQDQAQSAFEALETAMSKVQRAYRDITMDPALRAALEGPQRGQTGGTVPAYLNAQLANYQAGLSRLNSGPSSTAGLLL